MALTVSECHFGSLRAQLQAPGGDGLAHALGEPRCGERRRCRGPRPAAGRARRAGRAAAASPASVREVAEVVVLDHVLEREVAALHLRGLVDFEYLVANGEDAESGRQHEAFLRARDAAVDAPLFHPEVDAADAAHTVDEQERGMLASLSALRTPATSEVTPVAVSLCVANTALISWFLSAARSRRTSRPARPCPTLRREPAR